MRKVITGAALGASLVMASCATPYQDGGITGGVKAFRMDEQTVQIAATGNAFTSPTVIERYVMRKAAESTLSAGYDLFYIATSNAASMPLTITTPGRASTDFSATQFGGIVSGSATTTYSPGSTTTMYKPAQTVIIKMGKGPKTATMSSNVYDAREVLKFMAPPPPAK